MGMISDNVDFSKWAPILPLATRRLTAIVGEDVLQAIAELYGKKGKSRNWWQPHRKPVAFFAWSMLIPTLDAQHGASGRQKKYGENEKG